MGLVLGDTYTALSVLQEIVGRNLRIAPILMHQFPNIAHAFFDVEQLGGQTTNYTIKPKFESGITPMVTVDGTSIKWADYSTNDFETTVRGSSTPTITARVVTIPVADSSGFAENDRITIVSANNVSGVEDVTDAIVQTIDSTESANAITVKVQTVNGSASVVPATLAVNNGQIIRRLFWTRNDNDDITRGSTVPTYAEAQSYIQHFSRQITFNKQETNVLYKYEGDVPNALAFKFKHNLGILFQELAKAIYKGKNIAPGTGTYDKGEMLGLETIVREVGGNKNYGTVTTSHLLELYDDLESIFTAGGATSGAICMLVNDAMISQLSRVDRNYIKYDKKVDSLSFVLPTITTPFGDVELVRDPVMNILYPYPMAFVYPKKAIGLWVRENDAYDPRNGVSKADESVRIFERFTNLHEAKAFDMYFEMGMYAFGVTASSPTSAPFKSIANFNGSETGA